MAPFKKGDILSITLVRHERVIRRSDAADGPEIEPVEEGVFVREGSKKTFHPWSRIDSVELVLKKS